MPCLDDGNCELGENPVVYCNESRSVFTAAVSSEVNSLCSMYTFLIIYSSAFFTYKRSQNFSSVS